MEQKQMRNLMLELMQTSAACFLTTIDKDNLPQTRAMLNLRNSKQYPNLLSLFQKHESDFLVYLTTNTSSEKMEQIITNKNVSLYYSKPEDWRGLMLGGKIEIVEDIDIKKALWQDNWTMYYPGGPCDKDYSILKLRPSALNFYNQLSKYKLNMEC